MYPGLENKTLSHVLITFRRAQTAEVHVQPHRDCLDLICLLSHHSGAPFKVSFGGLASDLSIVCSLCPKPLSLRSNVLWRYKRLPYGFELLPFLALIFVPIMTI